VTHANRLVIAGLVFLLAACSAHRAQHPKDPALAGEVQDYEVFDGEDNIFSFSTKPGLVMSNGVLPEPDEVCGIHPCSSHPFVSGFISMISHDREIWDTLDASTDLEDLIARLRARGYRVITFDEWVSEEEEP
jgi:hypothetical protein